jgi:SagB-type dehydrogenase family enzyme
MRWSVLLVMFVLVVACGSAADPPVSSVGTPGLNRIDLPLPDRSGEMPLEATLEARRSIRDYRAQELSMEELSQLLWAAQGVTSEAGARTAPSAGGLYPIELYVVTPAGHYHYDAPSHALDVLGDDDLRAFLGEAALSQEAVADAPAVVVITAVYSRTEAKYGERAERYVHLEAGHAAQNLLLQAVALELAAVPIGAFHDDEVQDLLGIPDDHAPLYLIPVGHPAF